MKAGEKTLYSSCMRVCACYVCFQLYIATIFLKHFIITHKSTHNSCMTAMLGGKWSLGSQMPVGPVGALFLKI